MDFSQFPRWLIFIGIGFIAMGVLFWLFFKVGFPFFRLPGDIHIQKEKFGVYFPWVTSLIISIFLTIVLNFILWLMRK